MFITAAEKSPCPCDGSPLDRLRRTVRRIPLVRRAWHRINDTLCAIRYGRGVARWLYRHGIVEWMHQPDLRRQLPAPYRLFAMYCRLLRPLGMPRILGGETALKLATSAHRRAGGPAELLLDLGKRKVVLNLLDPRMLQVPHELLDTHSDAAILREHLRPGDTFIDIGANHGSFAIVAAEIVGGGGRVVAVEPQPTLRRFVERSLESNGCAPFSVLGLACGDHDGEIELFIPADSSGRAGVFADYSAGGSHHRVTVPLRRFDEAVNWRDLPGKCVLKLDIEGSELAFLRGASEMIRSRRPAMLLEVNPVSLTAAGAGVGELRAALIHLGYGRFTALATGETHALAELDDAHGGNILVN